MLRITTTLQKCRDSLGVILPCESLDTALFSENEILEILVNETGIKIQKAMAVVTLEELFNNYDGTYRCREIETGVPVGNEVW